ncbi:MAG TPA: ABC transporter substrate-binding protein [Burkholderiaceae bacterium]|nr:ABC transporter substrate-binding protein [Burkholderiaceae bacterium]
MEQLRQMGWTERDNLEVERRVGESPQQLRKHAAELVRLRVDLIVTLLTPAVLAARDVTDRVPIVMFGAAVDPVSGGLVRSFTDPGGNITGITVPGVHLANKSLELISQLRAPTKVVGVLANRSDPFTQALLGNLSEAAQRLHIRLSIRSVGDADEYTAAFSTWATSKVDAVFVQPTLATNTAAALALSHRLPSFSFVRSFAAFGGLLSYAADRGELARRAADYVDRILRGATPARLPIEQVKNYDLSVNLRTAKALGVVVPGSILLRATEVLE